MFLRRFPISAAALVAVVGATACRKPPPEENVYSGATPKSAGGSTTTPGGTGDPVITGGFEKRSLLAAIADCALGQYRDFEGAARTLRDATQTYATARTTPNADAVRAAWASAMASWSQAELFRIGPMAYSSELGGRDLRDQIYAWPLVSRCRIEEQLVSGVYATPSFGATLVNGRGLAAIEFLAFYSGSDNACSEFSTINTNGTWAALGADLPKRKAEYAAASASDIASRAGQLVAAWEPARENFTAQFVTAGAGSSVYPTERDALNAVSDALFYIENEVKDLKLGRPAGLNDCETPTCPEAVESPYARVSTTHLKYNLKGFQKIFEGCGENGAGVGMDDWLRAVGAGELADRMLNAFGEARLAVEGFDPPIEVALETQPARVAALHAEIKKLTDLMKTEMVTVLDLELPKSTASDND